jgi:hypothetical protein
MSIGKHSDVTGPIGRGETYMYVIEPERRRPT